MLVSIAWCKVMCYSSHLSDLNSELTPWAQWVRRASDVCVLGWTSYHAYQAVSSCGALAESLLRSLLLQGCSMHMPGMRES